VVAPVAVLDRVSPGYGPMIHRLLGAVALVVLVWLAGLVLETQIESTRVRIERQQERITELGERFATLRRETRRMGAPERMLPRVTAERTVAGPRR